jgi:hypothetical protein
MELADKVVMALHKSLKAEYIRLEDDDGISGFVVSPQFEKLSSLDRQQLIDEALRAAADLLTEKERRQVLMIAGITPLEYESVGAPVRVHQIKELGDGTLEVLLHGNLSDAVYVRDALISKGNVTATQPVPSPGAVGALMKFCARGNNKARLTKQAAIRILKANRYIKVIDP